MWIGRGPSWRRWTCATSPSSAKTGAASSGCAWPPSIRSASHESWRPTPSCPPPPAPNRKAWELLLRWEKPFLTAFSDSDPITRAGAPVLQAMIPGAKGQPHTTIEGAGHFLQEDNGEELAAVVVDFIAGTRDAES